MEYPQFIYYNEGDEVPAAYVQNEAEHNAQLIGWGKPPLYTVDERAALQAECDERGIEYDKRWGPGKLKAALAEEK